MVSAKVLFVVLCGLLHGVFPYRLVCVYTNWSQYRPDKGKFLPENVDPSMCTHLIYVYAKLKNNRLEPSEWNDESTPWLEGMYSRVNGLKQINPDLKTLLGVGGWKMGSKDFSRMAANNYYRQLFARTTVQFLRDRDFDGLAVDWQYPTQRGGRRQDKKNFSLLLKEIREAFEKDSNETGSPKLLLVAGVAASKQIVDSAYEVEQVSNYTDFLNVMAYDLHGSWDNFTGHPSPLFPRKDEIGPQSENNVDTLMKYWVSKGADPGKLVLGVSTYGRTFTLQNKQFNGYGVPTVGPGDAGDYTKQEGMLAFYERCSMYFDATRVWGNYSKVPYWHNGQHWIGGEDVESIRTKVNWVHSNELGGMMFWSLDTDDFNGNFCTGGEFPLISAAMDQFAAPVKIDTSPAKTNDTAIAKEDTKSSLSKSFKSSSVKDSHTNMPKQPVTKRLSEKLKKTKQQDANEGDKTKNKVPPNITKTNSHKLNEITSKNGTSNVNSIERAKSQQQKANKNSHSDVNKKNKLLSKPKKKQPQKGRRRKQLRRRRPIRKGRRRQRKRMNASKHKNNQAKTGKSNDKSNSMASKDISAKVIQATTIKPVSSMPKLSTPSTGNKEAF